MQAYPTLLNPLQLHQHQEGTLPPHRRLKKMPHFTQPLVQRIAFHRSLYYIARRYRNIMAPKGARSLRGAVDDDGVGRGSTGASASGRGRGRGRGEGLTPGAGRSHAQPLSQSQPLLSQPQRQRPRSPTERLC